MTAPRILVAGVGNLFRGDDAFGVWVARRLMRRPQPSGVVVRDLGLRALDLAYALEACDAAVLIDAIQRGGAPGTLYVVEPELGAAPHLPPSPHAMTPDRAVQWAVERPRSGLSGASLSVDRLRVVGCEPESFGDDDEGRLGLSAPVDAAIDEAVLLVERVVRAFSEEAHGA